jgi:hypothetical protein
VDAEEEHPRNVEEAISREDIIDKTMIRTNLIDEQLSDEEFNDEPIDDNIEFEYETINTEETCLIE